MEEFKAVQSLPVSVDFKGEGNAGVFMNHRAKWHKSCHLKFALSKLARVKQQLGKKKVWELVIKGQESQRGHLWVFKTKQVVYFAL